MYRKISNANQMSMDLDVPYFHAMDFVGGTPNSNAIALAIALSFYGFEISANENMVDHVNQYANERGLSLPKFADFCQMVKMFGLTPKSELNDNIRPNLDLARNHLREGKLVLAYTNFSVPGNFIVLKGFDNVNNFWLVHDPAGQQKIEGSNYKESGDNIKISNLFLQSATDLTTRPQLKNGVLVTRALFFTEPLPVLAA